MRFYATLFVLLISLSASAADQEGSGGFGNFPAGKFFARVLQPEIASGVPKVTSKQKILVHPETRVENLLTGIATNTQTGETLFAWLKSFIGDIPNTSIAAMLVNQKGDVTKGEFEIRDSAFHLTVCYNPTKNEFLLAYDTLDIPQKVLVQRLSARGKRIGKAKEITTDPVSITMSNAVPHVAFNPITGGYTLIWSREDALVGRLLNPDATTNGGVIKIRKSVDGAIPVGLHLAYQPSGNKLLLAYMIGVPGGLDYYLATVDPRLRRVKKSNSEKVNSTPMAVTNLFGANIALLPDSSGIFFFADTNNIQRRSIDIKGKLSGPSTPAFTGPQQGLLMSSPTAAFSTNSQGTFGILIATRWFSGPASSWVQVLDSKGLPVGSPAELTVSAGKLSTIKSKPADPAFRFADFAYVSNLTAAGFALVNMKVIEQ